MMLVSWTKIFPIFQLVERYKTHLREATSTLLLLMLPMSL